MEKILRGLTATLRPVSRGWILGDKVQTFAGRAGKGGHEKLYATSAEAKQEATRSGYFRTEENDPTNQGPNNEGMFYRMSPEVNDRLFKMGGYRKKDQEVMFNAFREHCLMVRNPALEIMHFLKETDFSKPVNRYVLWLCPETHVLTPNLLFYSALLLDTSNPTADGKYGSGKTFTLHHVMHYGFNNQFLMVHCSNASEWIKRCQESSSSESRPGRIDMPVDAVIWLQRFKSQNAILLPKLDLKTSQKYSWSLREVTEKGEPLTNIIDHGISRIKHASDCVAVILKEIKKLATQGKCKVLVACDMANSLYYRTSLKHADKREADVEHLTIARAFKKMFKNDWTNGAVVMVVDNNFTIKLECPDLPKHLLTQKGFEDLDPFVPIKVGKYTEKEMESCLDYYSDRMLLQREESRTEAGRAEIKFLSCYNPLEVYKLCTGI